MDKGNAQDQESTPKRRLQKLFAPVLVVVAILCVAAYFIPVLDGPNSGRAAREATAVGNIRKLTDLQNRFSAAHPEKGFTCQLSLLKSTALSTGEYDPERFLLWTVSRVTESSWTDANLTIKVWSRTIGQQLFQLNRENREFALSVPTRAAHCGTTMAAQAKNVCRHAGHSNNSLRLH